MTVCLCVRVCAHEVGNVDGVCVSSPFCSCKDAIQYLNESSPTEADRPIGAN